MPILLFARNANQKYLSHVIKEKDMPENSKLWNESVQIDRWTWEETHLETQTQKHNLINYHISMMKWNKNYSGHGETYQHKEKVKR